VLVRMQRVVSDLAPPVSRRCGLASNLQTRSQAQAGGQPVVGSTRAVRRKTNPQPRDVSSSYRHRSWWGKWGCGRRSFVQGRQLGIIGAGHHPR